MARCLIVACGCRGLLLGRELRVRGHVVRATTRRPCRRAEIEAAGAQMMVGDPDRVATLVPALEDVAIVGLLLGSAAGTPEQLEALHGSRLQALLRRMVDTSVRGIVYESSGSVDGSLLRAGAQRVRSFCTTSRIPYVLLTADPEDQNWVDDALRAIERLLAPATPR